MLLSLVQYFILLYFVLISASLAIYVSSHTYISLYKKALQCLIHIFGVEILSPSKIDIDIYV